VYDVAEIFDGKRREEMEMVNRRCVKREKEETDVCLRIKMNSCNARRGD
jgi:hypothetical protein